MSSERHDPFVGLIVQAPVIHPFEVVLQFVRHCPSDRRRPVAIERALPGLVFYLAVDTGKEKEILVRDLDQSVAKSRFG